MANEIAHPTPEQDPGQPAAIAPVWHTILLAATVLAVSAWGLRMRARTAALSTHHTREYLLTLVWEWALAAAVIWGLSLRRVPLRALLGDWPQGFRTWLKDAWIALPFWAAAALVLGLVGMLLKRVHLPLPDRTVAALAPASIGELLLFFALSLSAGICEELFFRGYFQLQVIRLAHGRVWVGVAASALLFGCAHLYEGAAGVISITIFGVLFSLLALKRRSLRPGMMAHAWHDGISGLLFFLLARWHVIS